MSNVIPVNVLPLTSDWRLSPGDPTSSMSGMRKYIECSSGDQGAVNLPNIGSIWSSDFPSLYVVRIEQSWTGDDPQTGKRVWVLSYEPRWINTQAEINDGSTITWNEDVLEVDIEAGNESITIPLPTADDVKGYKWESTDEDVNQDLFGLVVTSTMRVKRYVTDEGMADFIQVSNLIIGHVNKNNFYRDCYTAGTVLYNGFTSHPVVTETGQLKHQVELTFLTRLVTQGIGGGITDEDQPEGDGWNYIMNNQRTDNAQAIWDRPYIMHSDTKKFLYDDIDFALLWTTGLEVVDIPALSDATKY